MTPSQAKPSLSRGYVLIFVLKFTKKKVLNYNSCKSCTFKSYGSEMNLNKLFLKCCVIDAHCIVYATEVYKWQLLFRKDLWSATRFM